MGNVRVYVLARELGISSAEMLERLKADGNEAATASSSVSEDVAARYRGKPGGAAKAVKKPAAKAKPAAPPTPPPPKPIVRLTKAVKPKPKPKKPQNEDERAAAEERRQARLARLRQGGATSAPASPVDAAPPTPLPAPTPEFESEVEEVAVAHEVEAEHVPAEVEVEAAPPVVEPEPEPAIEETPDPAPVATPPPAPAPLELPRVVPQPEPTPEPEPETPPMEEVAAASAEGSEARRPAEPAAPRKLELPFVVSKTSTPVAPPRPPEAAKPAAEAPEKPATPARPDRPFRGPIRKIELPPQPPRPAPRSPGQGITRTYSNRPGTGLGKQRKKKRKGAAPSTPPPPPIAPINKGEGKTIRLTEGVTVKELADKMDVKAKDIIKILMLRGTMATVNAPLEPDMAKSLAGEFGFSPEVVSFEDEIQAQEDEDAIERIDKDGDLGDEVPRPPIVTVMGHVDHGKTSLLDAIRKTNVAAGEAGGITQSIGAYQVESDGKKITFVDTPGHEAFTTMRARGAQVTDLVVLVVAASDGVMPQTVEAINHAKAAKVPLIVAVNKIDLPNADPSRVKTDLMRHELVVEEFGGDVVSCEVSATQGTGIPDLLELIVLQSEILELTAMPTKRATGIVVEAGVDRGKGAVANVIVQDGTLRPGDAVIIGSEMGRVRALLSDRGDRLEEAGPSTPCQVTGLAGVPRAGDRMQGVESEARAREISAFRQEKRREHELAKSGPRGTLQDLSRALAEGDEVKELPIVVKADVHGAVEVLQKTITDLSTKKVNTKILSAGTGAITDSDVLLATAAEPKAIIVGFNVRPERSAADLAERENVVIRLHTVIYHLTEELRNLMTGLLAPIREEENLGMAEVKETFKVPRIGIVAGCLVQEGKVLRNANARLVRDGVVIWEGKMSSLKRFKEDARDIPAGMECGIGLQDYNDIKVGDRIEAFEVREIQPTLE
ncbi:MAG: translation initiation factor IF-2 [Acidobacteriota bacterium]